MKRLIAHGKTGEITKEIVGHRGASAETSIPVIVVIDTNVVMCMFKRDHPQQADL